MARKREQESPYQATLRLPRTEFPMRAGLPEREPEWQRRWAETRLYARLREERRGRRRFILHDGPPYANGNIHIGTALNKVLKDIIVRFANLQGYDAPFVPGWDTHGLPIELKAIRELGIDRNRVGPVELRNRCRDFARSYIEVMTAQFQRLGVLGDWENPYVTLDPEYEARQVEVFGEMARKGYIYKGRKPVYWCVDCETALAEAEIEYQDHRSPSIDVAFPVRDGKGTLPDGARIAIWTTTPWTIPANWGIALHPEVDYALYATPKGPLLVAEELAARVAERTGLPFGERLGRWQGRELEGVRCAHPLHRVDPAYDRDSLVILGEHVTTDEGTGAVHTAPGHGMEDFEVGRRYGLPITAPLDDRGRFTAEAGPFQGLSVDEGNEAICRALEEAGALLSRRGIVHAYAHCWRCKNPVIWRATEQWFASVEGFRSEALRAIGEVRWIPAWGEARIANMVADRSDWCISRQRVWGVPIPIFYCEACGEQVLDADSVARVADLFRREGSNAWYLREAAEILGPDRRCAACGGGSFRKESDIMDVWFDSGSSHAAVLDERPELAWPADLYLEGSDQHRGWFQSSLLTAVAVRGEAPYRSVLTHGFVVDGEGRKMSKSLGNVVAPEDVIREYGADVLRLWVTSADYTGDIRLSPEILKQLAEVYRKIRNTLRFLLGNLDGFEPGPAPEDLSTYPEPERWILHRASEVLAEVRGAYERYQFHPIYQAIHTFCVADLSGFYLDARKDRLYADWAEDPRRRACQQVLYELARLLTLMLAPILPHTAEEVWQFLPRRAGDPESVHLCEWPEPPSAWRDEGLGTRWEGFLRLRDEALRALEGARAAKEIGSSQQAHLVFHTDGAWSGPSLAEWLPLLPELLIVSGAEWAPGERLPGGIAPAAGLPGLAVAVRRAAGTKCERCWYVRPEVGSIPEHPGLCYRCHDVVSRIGR